MGIKPDITVKVPYLLDEEDGPFNMQSNVCFVEAEVVVRPYLRGALERLSKNFQLVLFTAAEPAYADAIMQHIDPFNKYFDARLYRQHCIETHYSADWGSSYIKDLRIIGNRRLQDLLIVDNAVLCFSLQLSNGIPVLPLLGGSKTSFATGHSLSSFDEV